MKRILLTILLVGFLNLMIATPALADGAVDAIANELMCQCGCTKTVASCDCGTAEQMRQTIKAYLDQGKSKEEILAYFVGQYGEVVLSTPTKKGFNLIAWVIPFAGIVLGAGAVYLALRKWVFRGQELEEVTVEEVTDAEVAEYEERLRRDLAAFDGS